MVTNVGTKVVVAFVAVLFISQRASASHAQCTAPPEKSTSPVKTEPSADYSSVMGAARSAGISFNDLPGFTRSVYKQEYAIVTPESRVWAAPIGWKSAVAQHAISPASGAHFSMYLADLKAGAVIPPNTAVERFVLVLTGGVAVGSIDLTANHFVYFPANGTAESMTSEDGASLVVYERVYRGQGKPVFLHGHIDSLPLIPAPGEVFLLRKALPFNADYDFNLHIMDFSPGEHLNIKEIHYNQHGLLMLEGQGIYRLGNDWYPVQSGDAIWMAPFVPQWYAALGSTRTRYIIYKDTTLDPLFT